VGTRRQGALAQPLRILFAMGTVGELTDGQLLERFATSRSEGAELAFEVLVERHGGMVLRVCRGVLGNSSEAEDAFQATFLVLVRRARGLWVKESLGPWLHQVAYRTARCALRSAVRRRRLEDGYASRGVGRSPSVDAETGQVLHEEIERLPERFRAPVVLCDLEGCSHEQAARRLGWPVGTVKSRQARGRVRLRDQLVRRGVGPERTVVGVISGLGGREVLIPPALIHGTVEAALRLGMMRGVAGGAAVLLMQGVLRTMWITQWMKVGAVVAGSAVAVCGVGLVGHYGQAEAQGQADGEDNRKPPSAGSLVETEVKRGPVVFNVFERGNVESGLKADEFNNVKGQTTLIKILPEGSHVNKGDIVCELDSASLKDRLVNQKVVTNRAKVAFLNAKLSREGAETAVTEYEQGILKQDQAVLENAIEVASGTLRRAESRLKRTKQAREQVAAAVNKEPKRAVDVVAELDLVDRLEASEKAIDESKATLELAKSKRDQYVKYTVEKTRKALKLDLDEKRAQEEVHESAWKQEQMKETDLEKQIARCVIKSPGDGVVIYANDPRRQGGPGQIEEGATVRERQKIFSVADVSKRMFVNVKVREPWIDKLTFQTKAKLEVHAFPDKVFAGTVVEIAPTPDRPNSVPSGVKVYTTKVRIDEKFNGLRPGMSVDAELFVDRRDDVLSVPVEALVTFDNTDHVAVKRADGTIELRAVTLGLANESIVEVKEGIREGEHVVSNPRSLMSNEEKRRKLNNPAKPPGPADVSVK
jgi:HlyD family secretion protein